jgi:hypothetical protein
MRHADLNGPISRLRESHATLLVLWEDAKKEWHDPVSSHFERTKLEPLGPQVAGAIKALERLSRILERAEKECT